MSKVIRPYGWLGATALSLVVLGIYVKAQDEKGAAKPEEKTATAGGSMIHHAVYFSLRDKSETERKRLIDLCDTYLLKTPGVVLYSAGVVGEGGGTLNDREFDIALFILFSSDDALKAYDKSDEHQKFIREGRSNWKKVRVFDAVVSSKSFRKE